MIALTIRCARCDATANQVGSNLPEGWHQHTSALTGATFPVCPDCDDDSRGKTIRSGENGNADDRLRLFMERIEGINEQIAELICDRKDVFSEAKATGYDTPMMREILKLRAMAPNDRAERDAILETYRAALGI